MFEQIKAVLNSVGIDRVGIIPLSECEIINQRILPEWGKSVVMFCIPYRLTMDIPVDGFSEYSRIYDYHKFSNELYEKMTDLLNTNTEFNFQGFCDHSPINEKLAAAKCGLGIIGRNSLFIDKKYGSFVFLGSIVTDMPFNGPIFDIELCENCGLCIEACPNSAIIEHGIDRFKCLSGISQKKKKTDEEKLLLKQNNIAWGCDICQHVCPHNLNSKISPIKYFKDTRITQINRKFIEELSDNEFEKYAFAYKGRKIVLDNIDHI